MIFNLCMTAGCNLRCVFCQNYDIAHQSRGFHLTPEELGEWYLKLQTVGAVHNINLVTPEHVVPQVVLSILHAKSLGLNLPVIYNTSSFDSPASLDLLGTSALPCPIRNDPLTVQHRWSHRHLPRGLQTLAPRHHPPPP